jgi:hypothetical protein
MINYNITSLKSRTMQNLNEIYIIYYETTMKDAKIKLFFSFPAVIH